MDHLDQLEKKRIAIYNVYLKKQKIGILFIVIAVLCVFISLGIDVPLLFILSFVFIVISFVNFAKAAKDTASFRSLIRGELIEILVKDAFEEVTYQPSGFIDEKKLLIRKWLRNLIDFMVKT